MSLDTDEIIELAADDILRKVKENDLQAKDVTTWLVEYIKNNINEDQKWNPIHDIRKFSNELFKESLIQQLSTLQSLYKDKKIIREYQQQLKEIKKEIKTFRENGFDEKVFERTKKKLYGRMIMGMNDVDGLANNMAVSYFAGEDVFTDFETYKTVTVEDIKAMLDKTLDENFSTLSVILPN